MADPLTGAQRNLALFLAILLAGAALFFMETRVFNFDALETIHSAWKISEGERIYADFDQPHHPGVYFMLAPVIKLAGDHSTETMVLIARLMALFAAGVLGLTYVFARRLYGVRVAVFSTLVLAALPWFAMSAFVVRADMPMLLFELAALFFLYRFFDHGQNRDLVYSAVCISVAFIFLQKAVFFAAFMGVLMLRALWRKGLSPGQLALYLATGLAVQGAFWVFMSVASSLPDYLFFNFILVGERQADLWDPAKWAMLKAMLADWQAMTPLVVLALVVATLRAGPDTRARELGCAALWMLATVLLVGRPYEQYYLPAMPMAAIVFGAAIARMPVRTAHVVLTGVVLFGTLNYVIWGVTQVNDRRFMLEKLDYVLQTTSPDDPIYDGSNQFNLFRKDLDFFWYGGDAYSDMRRYETYQKLRPYDYDIYALIDRIKPKIISHYFIDTTARAWILWRYRKHDRYDDIYERIPNRTGFDYWTTFVDTLETGSVISPSPLEFTAEGDIAADMTLGQAVGEQDAYVGLDMRFTFDRDTVDRSAAPGVRLTYKLNGDVGMMLSQDGVAPGREYMVKLPPADMFTTRDFEWAAFHEPPSGAPDKALNPAELNGVKFIALTAGQPVTLTIRRIEFDAGTGENETP